MLDKNDRNFFNIQARELKPVSFCREFSREQKTLQGETLGIKANQVELDFPYLMLFFTIFLAVLGLINVN